MQVIKVTVKFGCLNTCNIAAIYCPPRYKLKKDDYNSLFQKLGSNFTIGGDLNVKNTFWGSRLTSPKDKELLAAGYYFNCDIYSGGIPTYWPTDANKIPDLIDFFITKGITEHSIFLENNESLISDHSPVIMTISESFIEKTDSQQPTNHKTNWELFMQLVEAKTELQVKMK